ncbi:sigma-54 interaction domain-containing protein [Ectobacillus ponti]|nr:sigma 54-interacting transcriptional regulator [Ectobacillus ponti]
MTVQTQEMIMAILNSIDEAIHAVDHSGITVFYNEVAAGLDGLAVADVLGKHVLKAFPSLTEETSTLLQVLRTRRPIVRKAQRYQNLNGLYIDTINTTIPIMIGRELVGAVEIAKNYSTVKHLSERLLELQAQISQKGTTKKRGRSYVLEDILTNDPVLLEVKRYAEKAAAIPSPVLVYGETGTGKELFVQAIHHLSLRGRQPFIAQNCAALPESLLESLLFGTAKGSYTGAVDRPGLFELADGGTLFLDELNSMPLELQAKLLRVLEDGIVRRIGDQRTRMVDVRVITAMNEAPLDCVSKGMLRPDLYYRLNVLSLYIPPLRERRDDIVLLTDHFMELFNRQLQKQVHMVEANVRKLLHDYNWPGNVRELRHTIEHAMIMADGPVLLIEHLPLPLRQQNTYTPSAALQPLRIALQETERRIIQDALLQTGGNVQQAAAILDIPRQTLQYKIQKHHIHEHLSGRKYIET